MLTEPADLDRGELLAVLAGAWGLEPRALDYLPVGFGSHHWTADDGGGETWFVTVDDLAAGFQAGSNVDEAFDGLERAFGTAWSLRHEAGLDFVVAAIRARDDAVLRRLGDRYAVSVLPFVVGVSSTFGAYELPADRRRVGAMLGRLHSATLAVPKGLPRRDDFSIPSRAALDDALKDVDRPWSTGPFADAARIELHERADALRMRLGQYDTLAREVRSAPGSWVVTHGEPHRANVMEVEGGLRLVDWDTTMVAPRERDLWMILDDDATGLDEYVGEAGPVSLSGDALELYRQSWDLKDLAAYVDLFRQPHDETDDTRKTFTGLRSTLDRLASPG